jgi:hypothetical protein
MIKEIGFNSFIVDDVDEILSALGPAHDTRAWGLRQMVSLR